MKGIAADLRRLVDGIVMTEPEKQAAYAQDFGRVIHKTPAVVVRPYHAPAVARTLRYANEQSIPLSTRAAGFSGGGQSLCAGGIVLDVRGLDQIDVVNLSNRTFMADAGATWRQVLQTTVPLGLAPPVLTSHDEATIGGTHAAGGVGIASFRHGLQIDHCLGMEVATTTGDLVWCSQTQNSELFTHMLGGFGQFGIMTRGQHRLHSFRPSTRLYTLFYDDLAAFLESLQLLTADDRVRQLDPTIQPCRRQSAVSGKISLGWLYVITVATDLDPALGDDHPFLAPLKPVAHRIKELPTSQLIHRHPATGGNQSPDLTSPWIDVILPWSQARTYIQIALDRQPLPISPPYTFATRLVLRPLATQQAKHPMFRLPKEEPALGFGIYPLAPRADLPAVLRHLYLMNDLAMSMGGKRYLIGWLPFDRPRWRQHFDGYWPALNRLKQKVDPQRILNSEFIAYEDVAIETRVALPAGVAALA